MPSMSHETSAGVVTPPAHVQAEVLRRLRVGSDVALAEETGVSRLALTRIAAGLGVRRGSLLQVEKAFGLISST